MCQNTGEPSILKALRGWDDAPRRSFLRECQGCLLELLKQLRSSPYAFTDCPVIELFECGHVIGRGR